MCRHPAMRAPFSTFFGPYLARHAIRPGISFSASMISLRPNSARLMSAGIQNLNCKYLKHKNSFRNIWKKGSKNKTHQLCTRVLSTFWQQQSSEPGTGKALAKILTGWKLRRNCLLEMTCDWFLSLGRVPRWIFHTGDRPSREPRGVLFSKEKRACANLPAADSWQFKTKRFRRGGVLKMKCQNVVFSTRGFDLFKSIVGSGKFRGNFPGKSMGTYSGTRPSSWSKTPCHIFPRTVMSIYKKTNMLTESLNNLSEMCLYFSAYHIPVEWFENIGKIWILFQNSR